MTDSYQIRAAETKNSDTIAKATACMKRANDQLTAVGSAQNRSGYVLGMHLSYDPDVDIEWALKTARESGNRDGRFDAIPQTARLRLADDDRPPLGSCE